MTMKSTILFSQPSNMLVEPPIICLKALLMFLKRQWQPLLKIWEKREAQSSHRVHLIALQQFPHCAVAQRLCKKALRQAALWEPVHFSSNGCSPGFGQGWACGEGKRVRCMIFGTAISLAGHLQSENSNQPKLTSTAMEECSSLLLSEQTETTNYLLSPKILKRFSTGVFWVCLFVFPRKPWGQLTVGTLLSLCYKWWNPFSCLIPSLLHSYPGEEAMNKEQLPICLFLPALLRFKTQKKGQTSPSRDHSFVISCFPEQWPKTQEPEGSCAMLCWLSAAKRVLVSQFIATSGCQAILPPPTFLPSSNN